MLCRICLFDCWGSSGAGFMPVSELKKGAEREHTPAKVSPALWELRMNNSIKARSWHVSQSYMERYAPR
jgi:hypothetical protein